MNPLVAEVRKRCEEGLERAKRCEDPWFGVSLCGMGLRDEDMAEIAPVLGEFKRLWGLSLQENSLTKLDFLSQVNPGELRHLNVGCNPLKDLSGLKYPSKLCDLHLDRCGLMNVEFMRGLTTPHLHHLDLRHNYQISDIDPLKGLVHLSWLSLQGNNISDLRPLMGMSLLCNRLDLRGNPLVDLKPLEKLRQVLHIYLDEVPRGDMWPLRFIRTSITVNNRPVEIPRVHGPMIKPAGYKKPKKIKT